MTLKRKQKHDADHYSVFSSTLQQSLIYIVEKVKETNAHEQHSSQMLTCLIALVFVATVVADGTLILPEEGVEIIYDENRCVVSVVWQMAIFFFF